MITYEQVSVAARNNDPQLKAIEAELIELDNAYYSALERHAKGLIMPQRMVAIGRKWNRERAAIATRAHVRLQAMAAEFAPA